MNEIASDDELESENVDAATTAEALLRANISRKVNIKIKKKQQKMPRLCSGPISRKRSSS